jgi:hypothetical protein
MTNTLPFHTPLRSSRQLSRSQASSRRHTVAAALAVATCLFALTANAEPIGRATSVKPDAHANTQSLSAGSAVNADDTIRTGNTGVADLRFKDESNLSVGPASTVRLNKFVYDPNKGTGTAVIQASRGAFRFVSGSQGKGDYKVKTPYGTLGVRG